MKTRRVLKYQSIKVNKGNTTVASTYEFDDQLDDSYNEVIGVEAYENASGGITTYQLGIRDRLDTRHDTVNKNSLLTSKDVAQKEKAKPMRFDITSGVKTIVTLTTPETLTADLDLDVVFVLSRLEVEK